jgi:hypothetical protein
MHAVVRAVCSAAVALVAVPALAQTPPLASQETNWSGIVADVTEFKRKGNTLTAKVKLRNTSDKQAQPVVKFGEVYLLDTAAGKKYQVLRDEGGTYIASTRQGNSDQWYDYIEPGASYSLWMKFPAPPAATTVITLQLPMMAPFDDLSIQDQ